MTMATTFWSSITIPISVTVTVTVTVPVTILIPVTISVPFYISIAIALIVALSLSFSLGIAFSFSPCLPILASLLFLSLPKSLFLALLSLLPLLLHDSTFFLPQILSYSFPFTSSIRKFFGILYISFAASDFLCCGSFLPNLLLSNSSNTTFYRLNMVVNEFVDLCFSCLINTSAIHGALDQ
jgi:hypothetical protein